MPRTRCNAWALAAMQNRANYRSACVHMQAPLYERGARVLRTKPAHSTTPQSGPRSRGGVRGSIYEVPCNVQDLCDSSTMISDADRTCAEAFRQDSSTASHWDWHVRHQQNLSSISADRPRASALRHSSSTAPQEQCATSTVSYQDIPAVEPLDIFLDLGQ